MRKGTKQKKFKINRETAFRIMCIFLALLMILPLIINAIGLIV